ncbi:peptidyl serine alpha-galactosyltransferase-like [Cucurbita moschata]|uniref:Peptidyl serine alpha-galactosyltransferase-like n=1 Tax=Cucurbita moschata TaxID=3662 RepID=A0A6J1EJJ9_CUCMO|nr:peptidyl serine alpha-galactosyltransferase-like [Cucurbita moschata]XP_022928171.1 peptidyl serine alpha-galactosyltransferase-like [Cucurbita moschata]
MREFLVFVAIFLAEFVVGDGRSNSSGVAASWRIHTLFSVECQDYFDWQTVGLMNSFRKSKQPGPITRLLSCTDEEKKDYKGMDLAPTFEVPSMSRHPKTGDWYPAINKPAGVVHWLKHSKEAENVDWVVILDADMIIRGPIIPWQLGAEKGRPVAAYYGYLVGCDNILAKLHTKHPELCDKVGGLLAMHIDDLRVFAPMWLSKTEEVREDRDHWATNITGDIYGKGWISEMYGYSFAAAEVGLRHKINDNLMIYPGYIPRPDVEPILLHYGLPFSVGNWSFNKLNHHEDGIVYDCNRLFPEPPYPREIQQMESDSNKKRGLLINIECMNVLNEGLLLQHKRNGCPKPPWSKYLSFLKSKIFTDLTKPKYPTPATLVMKEVRVQKQPVKKEHVPKRRAKKEHVPKPPVKEELVQKQPELDELQEPYPKIHTLFSTECSTYFDWQTVGLMHSFRLSGQPGNITRLLSCTDEDLKEYKGHNLAPTHYVPSMSRHPLTGDWYPAINKPAAVLHWLNHVDTDAEFIVILDADMIMRGSITPWEFKAARGRPVSTPYDYLIGCDNVLAKLHTSHPEACDKVGGVIIMHIDDLRKFALLWLHKTEEVRADRAHYATNITGDIYQSGWISEMYGYSFGAAELQLHHIRSSEILLYPGYAPDPGVHYRVFHYGLEFKVGNWSFDKANWRETDMINKCWAKFPAPPDPSTLDQTDKDSFARDLLSIECIRTLNEALNLHHMKMNCPDPSSLTDLNSGDESGAVVSRKLGKLDDVGKGDTLSTENSRESSEEAKEDGMFSSLRMWIIALWAISGFVFMVMIVSKFSGRKGKGVKGKHHKNKRRSASYMSFVDRNGQEKYARDLDASL